MKNNTNDPSNVSPSIQFRDLLQARIHKQLQRFAGEGPAGYYRDAVSLLNGEHGLASTSMVVGHLYREMESALRAVLRPLIPAQKEEADADGEDQEESHATSIRTILSALDISEDDPVAQAWLRLTKKGYSLHSVAHRHRLGAPQPIEQLREYFRQIDLVFEALLTRLEERYVILLPTLKRLALSSTPAAALDEILSSIPLDSTAMDYFLGQLNSPNWLAPMIKRDFFRYPPDPQVSTDGSTVSFPLWPQSRFLVRMVRLGLQPSAVLDAALAVPDTDNPRIHLDLVQMALEIPAALAVRLAPSACRWAEASYVDFSPLTIRLAALAVHLACGGFPREAMLLTERLLFLVEPEAMQEVDGYEIGPTPRARIDRFDYERILRDHLPRLARCVGPDVMRLVCGLLASAVTSSLKPGSCPPQDYSDIWMSDFDEQDRDRLAAISGLPAVLTLAARDIARLLVDDGLAPDAVLALLRDYPWRIFRRLEVSLVRDWADRISGEAAEWLLNPLLDEGVGREWLLLLRDHIEHLGERDRAAIVARIIAGPEQGPAMRKQERQSIDDEEVEGERRRLWTFRRLAPMRSFLEGDDLQRYESLEAEFGSPDDLEPARVEVKWIGPTTPLNGEQLAALTVPEVIEYLRSWQPSGAFGSPTPEGLGATLSSDVKRRPGDYARAALLFQGLDPTYVRSFVVGLQEAVKAGVPIDWAPVLELCLWAASQPRNLSGRENSEWAADPSWEWTWREIVRLLAFGLQSSGKARIPFNKRNSVWPILEILAADLDPTQEEEDGASGSSFNPFEQAINSVRGIALDSIVLYAFWVRTHLIELAGDKVLAGGAVLTPEAFTVLDAHLDPDIDHTLASRAVYGSRLPELVTLDEDWVRQRLDQLFPTAPDLRLLREATWESYVVLAQPYRRPFHVLKEEYQGAIQRMPSNESRWSWVGDDRAPMRRLAEHLTTLYRWGEIDLENPTNLIALFYEHASPEIASEAMDSTGRSFRYSAAYMEPEERQRLMRLWETRVQAVSSEPRSDSRAELAGFGSWFVWGDFDESWSLDQLADALRLAGEVKPEHLVVSRLMDLADRWPEEVAACLDLIVSSSNDLPFGMTSESLATALNKILTGSDASAMRKARQIVSKLVARGEFSFQSLLDTGESAPVNKDAENSEST